MEHLHSIKPPDSTESEKKKKNHKLSVTRPPRVQCVHENRIRTTFCENEVNTLPLARNLLRTFECLWGLTNHVQK